LVGAPAIVWTLAVDAVVADVPMVATTAVASACQLLGVNVVEVPLDVVTPEVGLKLAVYPLVG